MSHIVETETLLQTLPALIKGLLGLMARERQDVLPSATGLANVIEATLRHTPEALVEHLDPLLSNVHTYLCALPRTSPVVEQIQSALLRSIELLGTKFTDQVVSFLQKMLENKNPAVKVGTLVAFKHIVVKLGMRSLLHLKTNFVR